MNDNKYIALIPSYNPDERLIKLVDSLIKEKFNIVVIDDGSCAESKDIFDNVNDNCHVIHHETNMGKGAGIKTGLKYIKDNFNNGIIVTVDCDGQHRVEDALNLCKYNEKHLDTICLGSRKFDGKVPFKSKFGNSITRFIFLLVSRKYIYDTQTGLRSFSYNYIDKMLSIPGERFEYEMNVLLEMVKSRIPIKEITIKTIYINNNSSSHFKAIRDSFMIYKEIFKFIFRKK